MVFKRFAIFFGPPALQNARTRVFAALIIKTVADLVADDGAYPAIIDSIVRIGIEEGRFSGWRPEKDGIEILSIIGVDGRRRNMTIHCDRQV